MTTVLTVILSVMILLLGVLLSGLLLLILEANENRRRYGRLLKDLQSEVLAQKPNPKDRINDTDTTDYYNDIVNRHL